MSIQKHIRWCKEQANDLINKGDLHGAYYDFVANMRRGIDQQISDPPEESQVAGGKKAVANDDSDALRVWIASFDDRPQRDAPADANQPGSE